MPEGGDLPQPSEIQGKNELPEDLRHPSSSAPQKQENRLQQAFLRLGKGLVETLVARDQKKAATARNVSEVISREFNPGAVFFPSDLRVPLGQFRNPDPEFAQMSRATLYELVSRGVLESKEVENPGPNTERIKFRVKDPELLKKIAEGKE